MTVNENASVRDEYPCVTCGMCRHFWVNADMAESDCRRLDHKMIKFAEPWFKTYDCGQFGRNICRDFEPAANYKRLCEIWTSLDDYNRGESTPQLVWLVIDNDTSTRYAVRYEDFIGNTFRNEDGSLRWVKKIYYRQSRASPTGYRLVVEWSDNENNGGNTK